MPRRPRPPAPEPDVPDAPAAADDPVGEAADALYGVEPERFVAERDARVKALRAAGDRTSASAVAALRRPTQGAWLVNLLVREQPQVVEDLLALGEALRGAGLDAAALKALSAQRRQVVDALVRDAARLGLARGARTSADTRGEVQQTLEAALLDADVAAEVRSGRLARSEQRSGFPALAAPAPAAPAPARPARRTATGEDPRARQERERREREEQERREREEQERRRAEAETAVRAAQRAADVARRAAEEAAQAQRQAQERAEHLREQLHDAERRAAEEALTARTAAADQERRERALAEAEQALAALD
ncbi:hypothetical protein [Vallicoccus soli]|uniref:Uncharacterized protein n=1 Tax=Vallicoccus soli TaxID=2339232 RepID=A0A3A3YQ11_9ACTN|nr:hypothetical protein [Vallicoccus soli]RJK92793.1 hypothetical protein D5H78_18235 [Vallicoccus soli]